MKRVLSGNSPEIHQNINSSYMQSMSSIAHFSPTSSTFQVRFRAKTLNIHETARIRTLRQPTKRILETYCFHFRLDIISRDRHGTSPTQPKSRSKICLALRNKPDHAGKMALQSTSVNYSEVVFFYVSIPAGEKSG